MRTVFLVYLFISCFALNTTAQLCPGGGLTAATAIPFDPAWVYGCNTGTSCNGGVAFDNRVACQPTTALDACAPAPSCGNSAQSASNVWFSFLPTAVTATISCFQNSSFVIGIQAFSGLPLCGTLTQIGCSLAGGPSSGVQLNLSGLHPGTLYYFRIFGDASPVSQRTGIYCFCGTTGLTNIVLSTALADLKAVAAGNTVELSWTTALVDNRQSFEMEHSADGISFTTIANMPEAGIPGLSQAYHYTDPSPGNRINYYRVKHLLEDGHAEYSAVVAVKTGLSKAFSFLFNPAKQELQITAANATTAVLYDAAGRPVEFFHLAAGSNSLPVSQLSNGVYFLRSSANGTAFKFCVLR